MKTNNIATGLVGTCIDGEPANEADHYYVCDVCHQAVDMRDLGQVFHHEQPYHNPIELDS